MFGVPLKNLALFTAVNIAGIIVVALIFFWLDRQFGLKQQGSAAGWIAPFATACLVAGNRYAKGSGWSWTREDRRNLAMAYAAVSFLIGLVFTVGYLAFDPGVSPILGTFWGLFLLVFGGLFGSLIAYAVARLLLGQVARQNKSNDHPSKVGN
jgi:Kef-type K+ transport system membrane component KefB